MFQNNFLGNNNLPYPADSLNQTPSPVNIQNPPFVPNVPCTQDFQSVLPLISGCVINNIVQGAQSSNLRAFTFNQISNNNYQNQDFVNLVTLAVSIMMYSVYVQKQNYQLEQLIQFGVEKSVEYQIAMNVAQYQALHGYLDQTTKNHVQNALNELDQLKPQLQSMMQQLQGGGGSSFGNNRPGFSGSFSPNNGQGAGVFQAPMNIQNQSIQTNNNNTNFGSKYGNIKSMETLPVNHSIQTPTPTVSVPVEQVETKPVTQEKNVKVPVKDSDLKWKRTDKQFSPPIVKRSEQELYIDLEDNVPTLYIGKLSDKTMFDYETHTTLTSFGVRPSTSRLPTKEEIVTVNNELNRIVESGVDEVTLESEFISEFKIVSRKYSSVVGNVKDMVLDHEFSREAYCLSGKVEDLRLFRTPSIIVENLGYLNERDHKDLDKLKTAETFEEMVVMLKSTAATMSKRPWKTIERRLTDIVNDVLRLNLSSELRIDSFLMDVADLMSALQEMSTVVFEAMKKHQVNILRHALTTVKDSIIEQDVSVFATDNVGLEEDKPSRLEFLYNLGSVTSVDIDSESLDIELFGNVGNMILLNGSKLLHSLAESIYNEKSDSNPINLDYILLNDGILLRITKGLVGEDYYIVSIVK